MRANFNTILLATGLAFAAGTLVFLPPLRGSQAPAQLETPLKLTTTVRDQEGISVTVYNSNIGLVKDVRKIQLLLGLSDLKFYQEGDRDDEECFHRRTQIMKFLDGSIAWPFKLGEILSWCMDRVVCRFLGPIRKYFWLFRISTGFQFRLSIQATPRWAARHDGEERHVCAGSCGEVSAHPLSQAWNHAGQLLRGHDSTL